MNRQSSQSVERRMASDGLRLRASLDPRGSLADRVAAQMEASSDARLNEEPGSSFDREDVNLEISAVAPGPNSVFGVAAALLVAAVLLFVFLPNWWGRAAATVDDSESVGQVSLALFAPSEIARLHPLRLLRSIGEPISDLVAAETAELERDVLMAAEGLADLIPSFLISSSRGN
ncbi:MAG: hypothetical protein ACI8QS_003790 [Planctomycetota bacterium]|jgi:hypothetical protein